MRSSWSLKSRISLHQVGAGIARVRRDRLGRVAVSCIAVAGGSVRSRGRVTVLGPLQRDAGGQHREEAVGVAQQRDAVRERDQAERQEFVEADRQAVHGAQVQHQPADQVPEHGADRQGRR